MTIADLS